MSDDSTPSSSLQVPKEWGSLKRPQTTKTSSGGRESSKKRFKSETPVANNSADSIQDICRSVCENMARCEDVEQEIDFSDVLSHIDYRGVLESLFGGRDMGTDVPIITKTYEESFMREPTASERKCIMGASCEAMLIDKTKPFIAVEFQLPNKPSDTPQMRIQEGGLPHHAAEWAGALHAVPHRRVSEKPLRGEHALHVTLHHPVRQPAFSTASGNVICPLRRVKLHRRQRTVLGGDCHDANLKALHDLLKEDYDVRWEIDTYLLAIHYKRPALWMVLDLSDTYHYDNLPDLTHFIRQTFIGFGETAWLQRLFNSFLCGKRYKRLVNTSKESVQISAAVINTLHGLLLGLYPFNERRSNLPLRAFIAGELHTVLVKGEHVQFIEAHSNLLCLSLLEYVLNVVYDFCPVEWTMLNIGSGAKSQCMAALEAFREGPVNQIDIARMTPNAMWSKLDTDSIAALSTLVKFFRDAAIYQHHPRPSVSAAVIKSLPLALGTRIIQNASCIFGQIKSALPDIQFSDSEALEEIWTSIYMRQLPIHTTLKQMTLLRAHGAMCHLVEHELHHLTVCMACAIVRRIDVLKGRFRYDCVQGRMFCNECMQYENVVSINMLGRILYVKDKAIVLCDECLRPKHWSSACSCVNKEADDPNECCICGITNIISSKNIIDIGRFKLKKVHFCYKHSLSCVLNGATVYDIRSMEKELRQNRENRRCP